MSEEPENISHFSPPKKLLTSLLEHYQNRQYIEAEKLALSITKEYPKHQFGWKVLGAVLKLTGKVNESLAASQKSVDLEPQDEDAHNNLGATLLALGRYNEAEVSYNKAITLKPDYAEAYSNLANTLRILNRLEEAEANYAQAITLKPNYLEAHYNLGITLKEMGRFEEAEASYAQAITLKPNFSQAHYNLGGMLIELGRFEEAIHHFDLASGPMAVSQSLECLYRIKNYSEFNKRILSISELDQKNIRVAAVSAFVAHQMKRKDPYPFCLNPLDFIMNKNLSEYDLNSNILMNDIIKEANGIRLIWESRTTKFGFQGKNDLFENSSKNIEYLKSILLKVVNEYYNKFKYESNSLIKLWPKKHKLVGWYNKLLKNGYQTAHIHSAGWISGVIYLKTIDSSLNEEGAIEFGLHGYNLPVTDENYPRKLFKPKRGDIILFPSSLFHKTIPFTQDTERCVIAFDLKPI